MKIEVTGKEIIQQGINYGRISVERQRGTQSSFNMFEEKVYANRSGASMGSTIVFKY